MEQAFIFTLHQWPMRVGDELVASGGPPGGPAAGCSLRSTLDLLGAAASIALLIWLTGGPFVVLAVPKSQ